MPSKSLLSQKTRTVRQSNGRNYFDLREMHNLLSKDFNGTVDPRATAYFLGVVEYVAAELVELSGNVASQRTGGQKCQITYEDIKTAIQSDPELSTLFGNILSKDSSKKK